MVQPQFGCGIMLEGKTRKNNVEFVWDAAAFNVGMYVTIKTKNVIVIWYH